MNRFGFSDNEWPLARVRWPRERPDHQEVQRYLDTLDAVLDRGPFAMITDLRDGAMLQPSERAWLVDELKAREHRAGARCVASAVVTGNVLMLALLRVAHLVTPPTYPFRTFRKMADAEAWVGEVLALRSASVASPSNHPPSP